jgi:hypothetical protein
MLLFRGEEHIDRSRVARGASLTVGQMWHVADAWYQDRADPGWRRKTPQEAEAVFASAGLTGEFWRLT